MLAQAGAAVWSLTYLALVVAWLMGAGGNPAEPAVDGAEELSLLATWGPRPGAYIITGQAATGVLLSAALVLRRGSGDRAGRLRHLPTLLAAALGLVLAVVLPDYRLLAAVAWIATAVLAHRRTVLACPVCGRGHGRSRWTAPAAAARWGRWATAVAVVVPLGYATTRFAWALGIPLGVSQELLDDLGNGVYAGAGLAILAVGGAVLTLGLVQRWGEVFPHWMLGLAGHRVPVGLAVVPATIVSAVLASAGLMFLRFGLAGEFGDNFPGGNDDVAAWLPEMFWPLWAAALAAAAYAYRLRRRGGCARCSSGEARDGADER